MANLQLVPSSGETVEVGAERTIFGRDPHADVVVNDTSVSRRHALVERRGTAWFVIDQGSANGTWIDDARVVEAPLRRGQVLRLGAVAYTVSLPEERPVQRPGAGAAPVRVAPAASVGNATRNAPPRPPAPAAPVAPSGTSRMTPDEAAALLGLWPGSPADEVRRQYQKIYNDLQIRLTNAPAPSLKRMYQKNLQDLKTAAEVLSPGVLG